MTRLCHQIRMHISPVYWTLATVMDIWCTEGGILAIGLKTDDIYTFLTYRVSERWSGFFILYLCCSSLGMSFPSCPG